MGRIGNFFSKIGKGIKKAATWASDHIVRPAAKIISNPVVNTALKVLGPVGKAVSIGGKVVNGLYGIHDNGGVKASINKVKEASSGGGIKGVIKGASTLSSIIK